MSSSSLWEIPATPCRNHVGNFRALLDQKTAPQLLWTVISSVKNIDWRIHDYHDPTKSWVPGESLLVAASDCGERILQPGQNDITSTAMPSFSSFMSISTKATRPTEGKRELNRSCFAWCEHVSYDRVALTRASTVPMCKTEEPHRTPSIASVECDVLDPNKARVLGEMI